MHRLQTYLGAAIVLCLPVIAIAMPQFVAPATNHPSSIAPAQIQIQGWWEQQGRPDELRDRYTHLRGEDARRYNEMQAQINDMQGRIAQLQREQQRLLHWSEHDRH
jgi:hypothetical protein